jgi:hypothetical protein
MPDIISQLSGGECSDESTRIQSSAATTLRPTSTSLGNNSRKISEESYRTVVTFLFSFIKRDKQCETLI